MSDSKQEQDIETLKASVNMLTTLIQSHQMLLNSLMSNKVMPIKQVVEKPVEKPVETPIEKPVEKPVVKKTLNVIDYNQLALEWVNNEDNVKGITINHFLDKCKHAIAKLPLQNTDDKLEDVLTDVVRNVYDPLQMKDKPFFCFGKRENRKIIYKNRSNEWEIGLDELVKQVYFLEKDMRIHQMNQIANKRIVDMTEKENDQWVKTGQIANKEVDVMTAEEKELWVEYGKWTTSEVSKSKIAKNLLEFIILLEF
jgi:hypothetical protein